MRKLTFTGSTEVGKMLAARAAAPDEAGVARAGRARAVHRVRRRRSRARRQGRGPGRSSSTPARRASAPTGSSCTARSHEPFLAHACATGSASCARATAWTKGTTIGPLIDERRLAKMERHVDDAVGKGATSGARRPRLTGEASTTGTFFAPTVLTDVTPDMVIYRRRRSARSRRSSSSTTRTRRSGWPTTPTTAWPSYVYTQDMCRAIRVSEALRFGIVGINDINPTSAAAPFGGMKESGLGREGGPGHREYLDTKVIGIAL